MILPLKGKFTGMKMIDSGKRSRKGRKNKKKKNELNHIHPNYKCDSCNNNKKISGIRYCCQVFYDSVCIIDRSVRIMICVRTVSVEHGKYILIVDSLLMILLSTMCLGCYERVLGER